MRKIDSLLNEYGESHQNSFNKIVHWICVPAIFFSLVGLLWSIPLGPLSGFNSALINWATIGLGLAVVYYITISPKLAIGMVLFAMLCIYLCGLIAIFVPVWQAALVIFILAWIGQFYGHKIEGKKPSFLKDVQFLLIGPAWLMHFIYKKMGWSY